MENKKNNNNFLTEFKQDFKKSSHMEKFNFFTSLISVSGVSILTVVAGINKIDTFRIAVYLILIAITLTLVAIVIGVYYLAIMSLKKDTSNVVFLVSASILTLFAIGFLLLIVTFTWEFITSVQIHS